MDSPPQLIDHHCHLDFPVYDKDRPAVLERARQAGVETIVVPGCWPDRLRRERALQLVQAHAGLYLVCGVHPHEVDAAEPDSEAHVAELAAQGALVGIGEIGLDFHYDFSDRDHQRQAFRSWLRLARRLDLPVVIHTREADAETVRILAEEGLPAAGGVIHCFSGSAELAAEALALGLHLGLTGMIGYGWAESLREIVRTLPLERLLVETDSPYLTPAPRRHGRNEPARVADVAAQLAVLLDRPLAEVAAATTANARRLYRLTERTR